MTTGLVLPRLRNDQRSIASHPSRRKTLAMGRRWGKTVLGGVLIANVLRQHGRAAWVVPTYKNGRPMWRWLETTFGPLKRGGMVDISRSERTITTHRGGFFALYSADNADAMRGEWFHLVINDEAARITEEARFDVIEPTVADVDGDIVDISTPRGRNWFYRQWIAGQDGGEYASWRAPSSGNPMPQIQRAYRLARERMSERTFAQEWDAQFLEDGGGVFRRVMDAVRPVEPGPVRGHDYALGIDWAQSQDFTVIIVLDLTARAVVEIDRFNQIDYAIQRGRVVALTERYRPVTVIAETNSIGTPIIEQLQRDGVPVQGFTTTNATKAAAIDALALAFERGDIGIPNDPVLIGELQAFEQSSTATGLRRFSAPEGMHDDCVMSLAMAWQAIGAGVEILW